MKSLITTPAREVFINFAPILQIRKLRLKKVSMSEENKMDLSVIESATHLTLSHLSSGIVNKICNNCMMWAPTRIDREGPGAEAGS